MAQFFKGGPTAAVAHLLFPTSSGLRYCKKNQQIIPPHASLAVWSYVGIKGAQFLQKLPNVFKSRPIFAKFVLPVAIFRIAEKVKKIWATFIA